jgi:hypothetical protein
LKRAAGLEKSSFLPSFFIYAALYGGKKGLALFLPHLLSFAYEIMTKKQPKNVDISIKIGILNKISKLRKSFL